MDVQTTSEARTDSCTDEDQLKFASDQNRVLITYNICDFASLHANWVRDSPVKYLCILTGKRRTG